MIDVDSLDISFCRDCDNIGFNFLSEKMKMKMIQKMQIPRCRSANFNWGIHRRSNFIQSRWIGSLVNRGYRSHVWHEHDIWNMYYQRNFNVPWNE